MSDYTPDADDALSDPPTVKDTWNMACPKCGGDESIEIAAQCWVTILPDGTDANQPDDGSHTWEDDSSCRCTACDFIGTVKDFEIKEGAA